MIIIRNLLRFWLEILLGGLILFIFNDIRWFLLYFLIVSLTSMSLAIDYLRKLVRVFQISNEVKLKAIVRILNISDEQLIQIGKEVEDNLTDEQSKSLLQDMNDIKDS